MLRIFFVANFASRYGSFCQICQIVIMDNMSICKLSKSLQVHYALCTGNHDLYALVIAHSADKCYLNTNTSKHVSECLRMDDGLIKRAAKEEGKGDAKVFFAMRKLF